MTSKITVDGVDVGYRTVAQDKFISLTDIAKYKNADNPNDIIKNWMRTRMTIEFLGIWERLNNPDFNPVEFDGFRKEAGLNSFVLSPSKWIEKTNAIGIVVSSGRYGGTFAHNDIALEFANWVSVEFRLYIIKEFQRLKADEQKALEWTAKRELAKVNYRIHTDAIKENLIVPELAPAQISFIYANEADMLNTALFGKTASEWKELNPNKPGNMRDYASVEQLLVLANIESYNAILIEQGLPPQKRIVHLNNTARKQLEKLLSVTLKDEKLLALPHS